MIRPIHPGLSPNVEFKDFLLALKKIATFWSYNSGNETEQLEKWFQTFYKRRAFAFASGRGALYAILTSFGASQEDEVLITGFTCVAVVDAVLTTGAKPIYVDIEKDFTLSIADLRKKVTKKTQFLILQDTFGIVNNSPEIREFTKKHKLILIEDLAHGIGLTSSNGLLGENADATLFSFGRDKAFSCVSGGIALVKDEIIAEKVRKLQQQNRSSFLWVFQNLFHTVVFYSLILPFYDVLSFGKLLLVALQKMSLLAKPIDKKELDHFPMYSAKLSPALAALALSQLQRLQVFNNIRKDHVAFYQKKLISLFPTMLMTDQALLRFPLLIDNPGDFIKYARKRHVYIGTWYSNLIDPKGTDKEKLFYKKDSCPLAMDIAKHIINLPTYPTLTKKEAEKVVTILVQYATH